MPLLDPVLNPFLLIGSVPPLLLYLLAAMLVCNILGYSQDSMHPPSNCIVSSCSSHVYLLHFLILKPIPSVVPFIHIFLNPLADFVHCRQVLEHQAPQSQQRHTLHYSSCACTLRLSFMMLTPQPPRLPAALVSMHTCTPH